jgi:LysR family transcriptional regulator, glycine cleavage system transcriptional activator
MARRLPPLNALPSFEAAARLLSFSKAAEELHVTHGAVSRAVRHLENQLGVQLFVRATRSIAMTAVGSVFAAEVRGALDRLAAAAAAAGREQSSGVLSVSTTDSLAAQWLVPRLFKFRRAHSGIDVRLSTSEKFADFVTDGIDIAIRYGRGQYPSVSAELLMEEDLSPVCSPKLLKGRHPLRSPTDLKYHTLIHDEFHIDWATWLRTAGITDVDPHRGPMFQSSEHAVQAAIQGEGVILGRSALVADDLASGRLVRPFSVKVPAGLAYYIVYPSRALQQRKIKLFRDWLLNEARSPSGEPQAWRRMAMRES